MNHSRWRIIAGLLVGLCLSSGRIARGDAASPTTQIVASPTTRPLDPADVPSFKRGKDGQIEARFAKLHASFLERGKSGPIDLLFIGDSITEQWKGKSPRGGRDVWAKVNQRPNVANFGISGDLTQHLLWRIDNGELDGIHPKVVVLLIGTNNIMYTPEEILSGDEKIISEIHTRLPDSKLLLMGIFPRADHSAWAPLPIPEMQAKIAKVNEGLSKLDDGNKTRYLYIGDKFVDSEGKISKDLMIDGLHPTAKGYQIWLDAMNPLLDEMMGKAPTTQK